MGCGASTGKDEGTISIEFKETGCNSVDTFFGKCKDIVDDLTSF